MGARLVSEALIKCTNVSDRAFRVLIRMALTALDEPKGDTPAHLYFGGRDLLALTLRAERGGTLDSRYRTVKKALAELIEIGAIERTSKSQPGQNTVYRLTLNKVRSIHVPLVDNLIRAAEMGDPSVPPMGDPSVPPMGDPSGSEWGTPADPPRNQEEQVEEKEGEEEAADLRGPVTVPRARAADTTPKESTPKCEEPTCAKGYVLVGDPPALARCPRCNSNVIPFPERKAS